MPTVAITVENIEEFRGNLKIQPGDLGDDIWTVFDLHVFVSMKNCRVVDLKDLVSTKNELEDPKFVAGIKADPRQTAFDFMEKAVSTSGRKRSPLEVKRLPSGGYSILDGNATAQVLMFIKWSEVPVRIIE
jgi:hypothetical protein